MDLKIGQYGNVLYNSASKSVQANVRKADADFLG